jgi:hypothetical protein
MSISDKIIAFLAEAPRQFGTIYQFVMNDGPCDKIYMAFWELSAKQAIKFDSGSCLYSLKAKDDKAEA